MRQVLKNVDPFNRILAMYKNEMQRMSLIIFVIGIAIWPIVSTEAGKTPSPVFVNKCCRIGEKLERNKECSFGGSEHWWPVIFMIMKNTYFEPHGEAPRFFKVNEFYRPNCRSPELIFGPHTMAVFSNGTLYLSDRGEIIDNENFCVDKDMALVCSSQMQNENLINPPKQTRIRKCCYPKEIYQTDAQIGCVMLPNKHEIIEQRLVENTTNQIEYRYGFPQCSKSNNNFAIVGKFNESKFDENSGNLTLDEGIFQDNQYCLEHFNDSGTLNVHVFTCTEYLPTSDKSEKVSQTNGQSNYFFQSDLNMVFILRMKEK